MFYYSYAYHVIYNCYFSKLMQRCRLLFCLNIVLIHVQCIKYEYNNCIITDGLTKCEIQYPTDEDDEEDDPERCQVRKSHCELYVKACAQWWIPYRTEQYGGKRFVCRPFMPVDVQGSAELHVYIHEDIQGIAEVISWYTSMNCELHHSYCLPQYSYLTSKVEFPAIYIFLKLVNNEYECLNCYTDQPKIICKTKTTISYSWFGGLFTHRNKCYKWNIKSDSAGAHPTLDKNQMQLLGHTLLWDSRYKNFGPVHVSSLCQHYACVFPIHATGNSNRGSWRILSPGSCCPSLYTGPKLRRSCLDFKRVQPGIINFVWKCGIHV